jgi:RNA polymerase sigma-70 factor (ECF subfamily)
MVSSERSDLVNLAKLCVQGDRKAQETLYKMYYGKMLPVCMRYAENSEHAKDILQDSFIKIFNKIKLYDGKGSLEGWIRRIVVNNSIDEYRRKKKDFIKVESIENYQSIEMEDEDEEDELEFKPSQIIQAMQELTPAYRTVFNLYIFEELTHREIGEKLGISEGTSKSNLAKAKRNLRNILIRNFKN